MKTIVLIRHSKSSRDIDGLADIQRPLNERGYSEAVMMSDILNKEITGIEKIISSPAIRAVSTALTFAPRLKVKYENVAINEQLYESGTAKILKVIQSQNDKTNQLMLVGHNPDFEELATSLVKTKIEKFPTTGIAIISFNVTKWADINHKKGKLVKLLLPEQFRGELTQEAGSKEQ